MRNAKIRKKSKKNKIHDISKMRNAKIRKYKYVIISTEQSFSNEKREKKVFVQRKDTPNQ